MKGILLIFVGLIGCVSYSVRGAEETSVEQAWHMMARFSSGEAAGILETQSVSPEQQLAVATSLLGKYPQTPQNVNRAEELLQNLIAGSAESEIRAAAYYLLARIEHMFREGREAQAEQYYQQLRTEFPRSLLADVSAVKLALLSLDGLSPGADQGEVRAVIEQLAVPQRVHARGDFHRLVASYLLEKQDLELAFVHLKAARDLGVATGKNRANLQVQIGRVGTLIHAHEAALASFEEFVKDYPTDRRNYMVQQEILKLRKEVNP